MNPDSGITIPEDLGKTELDVLLALQGTMGAKAKFGDDVNARLADLANALNRVAKGNVESARRTADLLNQHRDGIYNDAWINLLKNGDFTRAPFAFGAAPPFGWQLY